MIALKIAHEVLAEIEEGRPDAVRIVALARAVTTAEGRVTRAMRQRDKAEGRERKLRIEADRLHDSVDRMKPIVQAARRVLSKFDEFDKAPWPTDFVEAIEVLRCRAEVQ